MINYISSGSFFPVPLGIKRIWEGGRVFKGKMVADHISDTLKAEVTRIKEQHHIEPEVVLAQIGENKGSAKFLDYKENAIKKIGVKVLRTNFLPEDSEGKVSDFIEMINPRDNRPWQNIFGALFQLSFEGRLEGMEDKILSKLDPRLDFDCITPINTGRALTGNKVLYWPAIPLATLAFLEATNTEIAGKKVAIIGDGMDDELKITQRILQNAGAEVRINAGLLPFADIVITLRNQPRSITAAEIKKGATIIDLGNSWDDTTKKLVGDVDFDNVQEKAGLITAVPGGIGPIRIAAVASNVVKALQYFTENEGR